MMSYLQPPTSSLQPLWIVLLGVVILGGPAVMRAQEPRRPTPAEVAEIRERMRARQAERAGQVEQEQMVPWRQLAESPDQAAGNHCALVRLANDMGGYRAVWTFTPGPGNGAAPLRVPLCWRGEQWISLGPGAWRATVAVGRPDGARAFRIAVAEAPVRRGQVFELALGAAAEREVQSRERAALRELEARATGSPASEPKVE